MLTPWRFCYVLCVAFMPTHWVNHHRYAVTVTNSDGTSDSRSYSLSLVAEGTNSTGNAMGLSNDDYTWTDLSGTTGSQQYFSITIPAQAKGLVIETFGGSGDVDLYVKLGSSPSTSSYDCLSISITNYENCTFPDPGCCTYHGMLYGWATYSGVTLRAKWGLYLVSLGESGGCVWQFIERTGACEIAIVGRDGGRLWLRK